jgi:hypothetical protein
MATAGYYYQPPLRCDPHYGIILNWIRACKVNIKIKIATNIFKIYHSRDLTNDADTTFYC